jgi:TRAP-type C4-dicarboxylate transport system permease small subunit
MKSLKLVKKVLDRSLETLVIVVMGALVLDVLWQVFNPLIIKDPSTWTEELAQFMLVWVALLGAAVALNRGAHLGIDYFVGTLPERIRVVALFSFCVMIIGGMALVQLNLELGQTSPALGVKVGYVYLAVPISGFFLTLYAVIGLLERVAQWRASAVAVGEKSESLNPNLEY